MIVSVSVEIHKTFNPLEIEFELLKKYQNIIRWAVTDINDDFMVVSLSYIN